MYKGGIVDILDKACSRGSYLSGEREEEEKGHVE